MGPTIRPRNRLLRLATALAKLRRGISAVDRPSTAEPSIGPRASSDGDRPSYFDVSGGETTFRRRLAAYDPALFAARPDRP